MVMIERLRWVELHDTSTCCMHVMPADGPSFQPSYEGPHLNDVFVCRQWVTDNNHPEGDCPFCLGPLHDPAQHGAAGQRKLMR